MSSFSKQTTALKRWLKLRGWSVGSGKEDVTYYHLKLIELTRRTRSERNRLYVLMHECGHVKLGTTVRPESEDERPPLHIRCQILIEECLAWHHGREILRSLGHDVDEKAYFSYASKYLQWYSEVMFGVVVKSAKAPGSKPGDPKGVVGSMPTGPTKKSYARREFAAPGKLTKRTKSHE